MANLGRFKIETKPNGAWTNLTALAGIDDKCVIQNLYNACVVCEKDDEPNENEGFIIPESNKFQFEPGSTLWIKPFGAKDFVEVNINKK